MLVNLCVFMLIAHVILPATVAKQSSCGKKNWQCNDGSCIRSILKCDGQSDCSDGSDETEETCSAEYCKDGMFRCDYGACIASEGLCNNEADCVDGSDEDKNTCEKLEPTTMAPRPDCELPPSLDHGDYILIRPSPEVYGDNLPPVTVSVYCASGYKPSAFPLVYCREGLWENTIPHCVLPCNLTKHRNFDYHCPSKINPARECEDDVLSEETVITECKDRNYFSPYNMKCTEGKWDRLPVCKPECGRVTQEQIEMTQTIGDKPLYSPAPWHATLYSKLTRSTVCGGSLISTTVVVSAAHCFWDSAVGLLPVATYRVVVGTTRRQSVNNLDKYIQYRDVNDVEIPSAFDGTPDSLEYDIALVTVITPFKLSAFVALACLDFDPEFNDRQLSQDMHGTFASWDEATDLLKPVDLPYIDAVDCAKRYSATSQLKVTRDLICTGELNGTARSWRNSGTGLTFVDNHNGVDRFYLRGVASKPSANGEPLLFTQVLKHKIFIENKLGTA